MTTLQFRNLSLTPDAPVEDWGFEGLLTAVDRGGFRDWQRIAGAVEDRPWGPVARILEREVFDAAESSGVVGALRTVISLSRAEASTRERQTVAAELRDLFDASGLTRAQFADELGTSQSRLSTYLSGKVTPLATLVVRAHTITARTANQTPARPPQHQATGWRADTAS